MHNVILSVTLSRRDSSLLKPIRFWFLWQVLWKSLRTRGVSRVRNGYQLLRAWSKLRNQDGDHAQWPRQVNRNRRPIRIARRAGRKEIGRKSRANSQRTGSSRRRIVNSWAWENVRGRASVWQPLRWIASSTIPCDRILRPVPKESFISGPSSGSPLIRTADLPFGSTAPLRERPGRRIESGDTLRRPFPHVLCASPLHHRRFPRPLVLAILPRGIARPTLRHRTQLCEFSRRL